MNTLKTTALLTSLLLVLASFPLFAAKDANTSDRTAGQVIDDATITAAVKTALLADKRTEGFDINVDTLKGRVTLKGGADSAADKAVATRLAQAVTGVKSVDNRLVVAAAGSEARQEANRVTASGEVREIAEESGDEIDDAWITSKVKSQLLADTRVSGLAIDVDTEDNIVSLTGTVPSRKARNAAIKIARQTKGVSGVRSAKLRIDTP